MVLEARHPGLADLPPAASRRWRQGAGLRLPDAVSAALAGLSLRHVAAIAAIVLLIALLASEPAF